MKMKATIAFEETDGDQITVRGSEAVLTLSDGHGRHITLLTSSVPDLVRALELVAALCGDDD
jgi:hypothetical protein